MKREIIRVEGPCSAGYIAFSPLCIRAGPVAQRSEVMRWKSLDYRSHLRRRACRREASIGRRPITARKHAAPGLIGSEEPYDGQMARTSGPADVLPVLQPGAI